MPALIIPEIFYEKWFWFAIAIPIAFIVHFLKKKSPPTFPKTKNFLKTHKVIIRKALDVLLICIILFCWFFLLSSNMDFFKSPLQPEPVRAEIQQFERQFLLITIIIASGQSGFFLGLISLFQSNLTKTKRIILLFACLIPVVFTALLLLTDKILGSRSILRLCINSSFLNWLINAPAIILNKPFFQFAKGIEKKLKLMFGGQSTLE